MKIARTVWSGGKGGDNLKTLPIAIIIPCVMSFYIMLCRNLIYTGITRAKKNVILVGDKKALSIAISNNKSVERYTQLEQRVSKLN